MRKCYISDEEYLAQMLLSINNNTQHTESDISRFYDFYIKQFEKKNVTVCILFQMKALISNLKSLRHCLSLQ